MPRIRAAFVTPSPVAELPGGRHSGPGVPAGQDIRRVCRASTAAFPLEPRAVSSLPAWLEGRCSPAKLGCSVGARIGDHIVPCRYHLHYPSRGKPGGLVHRGERRGAATGVSLISQQTVSGSTLSTRRLYAKSIRTVLQWKGAARSDTWAILWRCASQGSGIHAMLRTLTRPPDRPYHFGPAFPWRNCRAAAGRAGMSAPHNFRHIGTSGGPVQVRGIG